MKIMRVASFVLPNKSGVAVVDSIRSDTLTEHGVDVQKIYIGPHVTRLLNSGYIKYENSTVIDCVSIRKAIINVNENLVNKKIDAIIIDIYSGVMACLVAMYAPENVRRIYFIHSINEQTLHAARILQNYCDLAICVSPRVEREIIRESDYDPRVVKVIPNCVRPYNKQYNSESIDSLDILYMGRIEDESKGVFDIPKILKGMNMNWRLTIAGEGPDLCRLKKMLNRYGSKIRYIGAYEQKNAQDIASKCQILLMPSRYEGFGITAVEAMSVGCIPVATLIDGVTDYIIQDEINGFLFERGDYESAINVINRIASDRNEMNQVSDNAIKTVNERYNYNTVSKMYYDAISDCVLLPYRKARCENRSRITIPAALRPGMFSKLPELTYTIARGLYMYLKYRIL